MGRGAPAAGGLEGVVATTTAISSILGRTLTYRGIDIDELVERSSFEEVAYLLWNGELPTSAELTDFRGQLAARRSLPELVLSQLRDASRGANSMATLRTAISLLASADPPAEDGSPEANRETSFRLLAAFPSVVAAIGRLRMGKDPLDPDPELGEAANFLYMLTGKRPTPLRARILDQVLILHADHELNASTFATRVAASTQADMYSAVIAGICTLKGPLHGGASEAVRRMLLDIPSPNDVQTWIQAASGRGDRIMGFGHRVYREGDPRAQWLKRMAGELAEATGEPGWYELSVRFDDEVRAAGGPPPNVDFYSVAVYAYLGVSAALFTPIFAVSRVSGWIAHILEQYGDNRLIRPRAEYIGPSQRRYTRIEER